MSNKISNNPRHFYEFDSFRLDTVERQLRRDGKSVPLTPKAFETLFLLVENSGCVLEKDQLMQTLWPEKWSRSSILFAQTHASQSLSGASGLLPNSPFASALGR